jgi:hypothetical protein
MYQRLLFLVFVFTSITQQVLGQKVLLKLDSLQFNEESSAIVRNFAIKLSDEIFKDANRAKLIRTFPEIKNVMYKAGKYKMFDLVFEIVDGKMYLASFKNTYPKGSREKACLDELFYNAFGKHENIFCEFLSFDFKYEWGSTQLASHIPISSPMMMGCIGNPILNATTFKGICSVVKGFVKTSRFMDINSHIKNKEYQYTRDEKQVHIDQINEIIEDNKIRMPPRTSRITFDFLIDSTGSIIKELNLEKSVSRIHTIFREFIYTKVKFIVASDFQGMMSDNPIFHFVIHHEKLDDFYYFYNNFRYSANGSYAIPIGHK